MKSIQKWAVFLILGIWAPRLFSVEPILPPRLSVLVAEAVQNNPEILAANEKTQAVAHSVSAEASWPDPMLTLGLLNLPVDTWYFDQEPMTGKQVRVTQRIPFPGKLALKGNIAEANVEILSYQHEEIILDVTKRVKKTWFSMGYFNAALRQNQAIQELVRSIRKSARSHYRAGEIGLADVLEMEQFENQLYQQQLEFKSEFKKESADMNYLLRRPSGTAYTDITVPAIPDITIAADTLLERVIRRRPILLAWRARIRKYEKITDLARKNVFPDIALGVAYTQREELRNGGSGIDFFSGTVGIAIPLFVGRKQLSRVNQQRRELQAVKQEYASLVESVRRDISQLLAEIEKNSRLLNAYQHRFLPQAQDAFSSTLAAYQSGGMDLQNVMLRQKQVLDYELAVTQFRTKIWVNWVELERLSGLSIDELLSEGANHED